MWAHVISGGVATVVASSRRWVYLLGCCVCVVFDTLDADKGGNETLEPGLAAASTIGLASGKQSFHTPHDVGCMGGMVVGPDKNMPDGRLPNLHLLRSNSRLPTAHYTSATPSHYHSLPLTQQPSTAPSIPQHPPPTPGPQPPSRSPPTPTCLPGSTHSPSAFSSLPLSSS